MVLVMLANLSNRLGLPFLFLTISSPRLKTFSVRSYVPQNRRPATSGVISTARSKRCDAVRFPQRILKALRRQACDGSARCCECAPGGQTTRSLEWCRRRNDD